LIIRSCCFAWSKTG